MRVHSVSCRRQWTALAASIASDLQSHSTIYQCAPRSVIRQVCYMLKFHSGWESRSTCLVHWVKRQWSWSCWTYVLDTCKNAPRNLCGRSKFVLFGNPTWCYWAHYIMHAEYTEDAGLNPVKRERLHRIAQTAWAYYFVPPSVHVKSALSRVVFTFN